MTEHVAPAVQVRLLTPERAGNFLAFFNHRSGPAFSDNPEWAKCHYRFCHTEAATNHYHGPLPLFIEAGFGMIWGKPAMTVVRKTLTPP
jgi:hypothetical protein